MKQKQYRTRYHGRYFVTGDYTAIKIMIASVVFGWVILNLNWSQWIVKAEFASPVNKDLKVVEIEKQVPVKVEVPIGCKTEKCQILAYLIEKFQDDAANAITMIRKCENSTFDPNRVSGLNIQKSGRRSYDIGVMQINVDELNTKEIERLKDYKYNIDRGYAKYKASGNTFHQWSCAEVIGQKSFKDD
jgi:hypothetical protein